MKGHKVAKGILDLKEITDLKAKDHKDLQAVKDLKEVKAVKDPRDSLAQTTPTCLSE